MRSIFIVNATQIVTSEAHPEGLFSTISGYPKTFDSRSYSGPDIGPDGDAQAAANAAKAEYYARLSANYSGSPNRVMSTVTLSREDGFTLMYECVGEMPEMD